MLAVSKINIVSLNICRYEVSYYVLCSNPQGQQLQQFVYQTKSSHEKLLMYTFMC